MGPATWAAAKKGLLPQRDGGPAEKGLREVLASLVVGDAAKLAQSHDFPAAFAIHMGMSVDYLRDSLRDVPASWRQRR